MTDGMSSAHHILVVMILRYSALISRPISCYLRGWPGRRVPAVGPVGAGPSSVAAAGTAAVVVGVPAVGVPLPACSPAGPGNHLVECPAVGRPAVGNRPAGSGSPAAGNRAVAGSQAVAAGAEHPRLPAAVPGRRASDPS